VKRSVVANRWSRTVRWSVGKFEARYAQTLSVVSKALGKFNPNLAAIVVHTVGEQDPRAFTWDVYVQVGRFT
jgi:hypothetical protein